MPVIQIQWLAGRTVEQRREIAEAITDDVSRLGNCPREAIHVVFTDVERDHWSTAGTLRSDD